MTGGALASLEGDRLRRREEERALSNAGSLALYARDTIARGSKSFALASSLFDPEMRVDAQLLYAWCRHCDDLVDGQDLGGDAPDPAMTARERRARLEILRSKTLAALGGDPPAEPAFLGLAHVAKTRALPACYALAHVDGFTHDVEGGALSDMNAVLEYSYGVAGVVGVMMAIVMGVDPGDDATLDRACDLGLAFQLTNICRDVKDDAEGSRVYLPADELVRADVDPDPAGVLRASPEALFGVVERVLDEADRYYDSAGDGLRMLPVRAAAAIGAARNVYRDIGLTLRQRGPDGLTRRTVVGPLRKSALAAIGAAAGASARGATRAAASPRKGLWVRPVP